MEPPTIYRHFTAEIISTIDANFIFFSGQIEIKINFINKIEKNFLHNSIAFGISISIVAQPKTNNSKQKRIENNETQSSCFAIDSKCRFMYGCLAHRSYAVLSSSPIAN